MKLIIYFFKVIFHPCYDFCISIKKQFTVISRPNPTPQLTLFPITSKRINDHLNLIFNELTGNLDQMKLRNQNQKGILEVSLDLKIYFNYTVYSYRLKKILYLIVFFHPKNSKLYVVDTWL